MQGKSIDIFRRGIKKNTAFFLSSCSVTKEVMECGVFSAEFVSPTRLSIERGDYVLIDGEKYYFLSLPNEEKNATGFTYSATLKNAVGMLDLWQFLFLDQDSTQSTIYATETDFDLTATVGEFADLIRRNLNRNSKETWSYVVSPALDTMQTKNIAFSANTCRNALDTICEEFEVEWMITGNVLNISKKHEISTPVRLSYPLNVIAPVRLENADSENYCTKLFVYGGERNIPSGYNNGKSNRLLMSGKKEFLKRDGDFIVEKVKTFDDVYPRRNSFITAEVTTERGVQFVFDSTLDFDINEQLTENTAKISFTSGQLVGYEFEIASYNNTAKRIEIKQQTEGDVVIPNQYMKAKAGDKYVLLDIEMPSTYISNAENELEKVAQDYFDSECVDSVSAQIDVSSIWLNETNTKIEPYQVVRLLVNDLDVDRRIRVEKVTYYPFDYETYGRKVNVTLANYKRKGKVSSIVNSVNTLQRSISINARNIRNNSTSVGVQVAGLGDKIAWKEGEDE